MGGPSTSSPSTGETTEPSAAVQLDPEQTRTRWRMVQGFEPSVRLYGELGALGRVRRTRAAIVKPGTPDRSRRRARRAICGTPGAPSHGKSRARDRLRRLQASGSVSVRLLGK